MRNHYVILSTALLLNLSLVMLACQSGPPPEPPDTRAADEAAIRAAVVEWSKSVEAKDVEKFVSFYEEGASLFPPGAPKATGKEAIRTVISNLMSAPGFNLNFATDKVEVSRSGDLAYETGTYQITTNDATGTPVQSVGKYVVAWKKQADGSWKVVADIFNADQ